MNYLMKKAVNLNGQDMMLAPLDIDFAHRTISLTGEIDEDVATVMNSSLRCLARDSDDDITIYIQSPGGSVSAGFSIYDTVKALKCDVVTVACGMAASMGAFLLPAECGGSYPSAAWRNKRSGHRYSYSCRTYPQNESETQQDFL